MKRRFLALRIISIIYKILAVFALIGMIGGAAWVLLDATTFPTMQDKIQPLGAALGGGVFGALVLFAIAQFLDLLMALEINTRASNAMLQQLGKVMKRKIVTLVFNSSIRYQEAQLYCDSVPVREIVTQTGTPVYIYSLPRILENFQRVQAAFPTAHIHYSAKANANLALLATLVSAGAGIDAVSGGEIYRALLAHCPPEKIVFAGVGKTAQELYYAVEQDIGWFNLENVHEADNLNCIAAESGKTVRTALRFNPDVAANTHPNIATGHSAAKFGLSAAAIRDLLARQDETPNLRYEGIHIHIGSQLHDTAATEQALRATLDLIAPYPQIRTVDLGGGLPVAYTPDEELPPIEAFAAAIMPLLDGYEVILEPGRRIIADAGIMVTRVVYLKEQGGQRFVIVDAGMTDLIRPALYHAHHEIIPLVQPDTDERQTTQVVGPVCETTDTLGHDIVLPPVSNNDYLAVMTAGAYGMAMASNYNARPRPPEVVVSEDGGSWHLVRRRETWDDMVQFEMADR